MLWRLEKIALLLRQYSSRRRRRMPWGQGRWHVVLVNRWIQESAPL